MTVRRPRLPLLASALAAALVVPAAAVAPASAATPAPEVIVTEILANTVGDDHFEYVEVHNTTAAPIDFAAEGVSLAYSYVDSDDRAKDVPLTVEEALVLGPHETAVLWLSYTSGRVDSFAYTADDFRASHGVDATTPVVRLTGQAGMANGGDRGIRVLRGDEVLSWSHSPAGSMGEDVAVHFRLPADPADLGLDVLASQAPRSPGTVAPEALERADAGEPEPGFDPQPDPSIVTAPLQVTELLPDSRTNVSGSDAYEFVEMYNATSSDIDFSDYSLNYLYPDTGTAALWPAEPADVVIPGGGTLVFWIKNGANDALGEADFNAEFGTTLALGRNLVEVHSDGMANGSARGIEVVTHTGHTVSRALYNLDVAAHDDTVPGQGIRYTPSEEDLTRQRLLDLAPATPGTVQADQVPGGLMIVADDTVAPVIVDRTEEEIDPAADFALSFAVTDDVLPRTVTLTLGNDVDAAPLVQNLTDGGDGVYSYVVPAVDLVGKSWFEYRVTASDGTNESVLETRRASVIGGDRAPVRLNLAEGAFVSGVTDVIAGGEGYPAAIGLSIGGEPAATTPSLEREPVFAFEVIDVNFYFKNGIKVGDDVLRIFDDTVLEWTTLSTSVPLEYTRDGDELVVSVWSGTKKAPEIDLGENNDDFRIRNLRLVLPDGRTLAPAGYDDPSTVLGMGDSVNEAGGATGKLDFSDARFTLPEDAFSAVSTMWDTTGHADGPVEITAQAGEHTLTRQVTVDNTAPVVTSRIVDGTAYQGEIMVDAVVADAGAGVDTVVATLDGTQVTLPHTTSSVTLAAGDHVFEVTATDRVGNTGTWSAMFTTYEEQPSSGALRPAEGDEVRAGNVSLSAKVDDPTGDVLDVAFLEGRRLDLADGDVATAAGTVQDALDPVRAEPGAVSGEMLRALAAVDGIGTDLSSSAAFPYQLFDVTVAEAGPGAKVRATWSGRANAGATVVLYAQRTDGSGWDEVTRHVSTADDEGFALIGMVDADAYAVDGRVRLLVQHSEGFSGEDLSDRSTPVVPANEGDVPRTDYDFTLGWESDTQYYNENTVSDDAYRHQRNIHSYFLDRREELNLQYVFHTGDIVDDWNQEYQWQNADPEYRRLDEAGLPYGVLAGNHDVGHELVDYTDYARWFGESRFAGNPWYGGSYRDNRGHYDLLSAGGIDFLMVYQGWGPGDEEIAWMNEVLAQYPDRVAIIAQHEFILTTGGLGEIPQRIMDEVVATNPNVRMVFSGHYHDALTRTDAFDDDGDGVEDRTVYSMLFDYQGLPEGGLGYLRLLHFDNEGERMMVRTYSPSLDDYNSDEPTLLGPDDDPYANQEFELTYAQLGIEPAVRTLGTDAFAAEVLTAREIASFDAVASGSVLTATWPLRTPGEHGWYVRTTDPYGAVDHSPVSLFTVVPAAGGGETPGGETPGGQNPGADTPSGEAPGSEAPETNGPGTGPGGSHGDTGGDAATGGSDTGGKAEDGRDALATTGGDSGPTAAPWLFGGLGLLLAGLAFMRFRRHTRLG